MFLGSAAFVAFQLSLVRRDSRLRARYEYFGKILDLSRMLIENPKAAKELPNSASWGQSEKKHVFFYILNFFEMITDVRVEGLTGEKEWKADRAFFKETMKADDFSAFWKNVSKTGIYTEQFRKTMDEALEEAEKERAAEKATSSQDVSVK